MVDDLPELVLCDCSDEILPDIDSEDLIELCKHSDDDDECVVGLQK